MVLYLQLDSEFWHKGDFTSSAALALTGTVYSDATMLTPFDLTGYTLEIKGFNQRGEQEIAGVPAAIVSEAAGTFVFAPEEGDFNQNFVGELHVILTKAGTRVTATGRNGSATFYIEER